MTYPPPLPSLSLTVGVDTYEVERRLGERDSDGEIVGYIDPQGLCHVSRQEAEAHRACGVYMDAAQNFIDSKGPRPCPWRIARAMCAPENFDVAIQTMAEEMTFWMKMKTLWASGALTREMLIPFELPAAVSPSSRWIG